MNTVAMSFAPVFAVKDAERISGKFIAVMQSYGMCGDCSSGRYETIYIGREEFPANRNNAIIVG